MHTILVTLLQSVVSIVSIQTDQSRLLLILSIYREWFLCFNRINPNRSIPTILQKNASKKLKVFQSYQSKQINPDMEWVGIIQFSSERCFNRINPNRSIPTKMTLEYLNLWKNVSIVSIQTDQSRRGKGVTERNTLLRVSIVSIQTDQSRRLNSCSTRTKWISFNRINPNRSIPTSMTFTFLDMLKPSFNRINPNRSIPTLSLKISLIMWRFVSIVSIQTDQSRHL